MKAIIALSLAATAYAATPVACQIPETYVTVTGTACTGPKVGYKVFGVCVPGGNRAVYGLTSANDVRVPLSTASLMAFTSVPATNTITGCVVPSYDLTWGAANDATAAGIVTSTTVCIVPAAATITPSEAAFSGVDIECDRDAGFWPSRGFEGTNICIPITGAPFWTAAMPAPPAPYWQSASVWESFNYGAAIPAVEARSAEFTGTNALVCSRGCVLPTTICSAGRYHANIVAGWGNGYNEATCTLRPQHLNVENHFFWFQCRTAYGWGDAYRVSCPVDATTALSTGTPTITPAYTGQCGGRDGAQTNPIWNFDGRLDGWTGKIGQPANAITNYPTVTSSLIIAYQVTSGAYATVWRRSNWNNNAAQDFHPGNIYEIVIEQCWAFTGPQYVQCVQQTLNWWRCYYDFIFCGGTICWYDWYFPIPCPTHELGFRCPTSSKKGLLGLLGLLGLIPLFLLCCCLLFCCCIRRRKTEADVHFATFDPHAAPVIATAPCATATACPTAFGATPFATHASAIPCL